MYSIPCKRSICSPKWSKKSLILVPKRSNTYGLKWSIGPKNVPIKALKTVLNGPKWPKSVPKWPDSLKVFMLVPNKFKYFYSKMTLKILEMLSKCPIMALKVSLVFFLQYHVFWLSNQCCSCKIPHGWFITIIIMKKIGGLLVYVAWVTLVLILWAKGMRRKPSMK